MRVIYKYGATGTSYEGRESPQVLRCYPAVKGGVKVDQSGGAKGSHLGREKDGWIAGAKASGA